MYGPKGRVNEEDWVTKRRREKIRKEKRKRTREKEEEGKEVEQPRGRGGKWWHRHLGAQSTGGLAETLEGFSNMGCSLELGK